MTDREAVAREIDSVAIGWTKPWRQHHGFYTNPDNGPFREAEIARDEDDERSNMMRRKAEALAKADRIIARLSPTVPEGDA